MHLLAGFHFTPMNQPGHPSLMHSRRPPVVRPSILPDRLRTTRPRSTLLSATTGNALGHRPSFPSIVMSASILDFDPIVHAIKHGLRAGFVITPGSTVGRWDVPLDGERSKW